MKIKVNLDHRSLIEVCNCCSFEYYSNSKMFSIFFDKKADRDACRYLFEKSLFVSNINESDNLQYPYLTECYKLYIIINYPVTISVVN